MYNKLKSRKLWYHEDLASGLTLTLINYFILNNVLTSVSTKQMLNQFWLSLLVYSCRVKSSLLRIGFYNKPLFDIWEIENSNLNLPWWMTLVMCLEVSYLRIVPSFYWKMKCQRNSWSHVWECRISCITLYLVLKIQIDILFPTQCLVFNRQIY